MFCKAGLALAILMGVSVFAGAEPVVIPAGAQYEQLMGKYEYPGQFDKFFADKKFGVVKSSGEFSGTPNLQWLNRIYIGSDPGQTILVRTGLALKNFKLGQLYSSNGNYLIHIPSNGGSAIGFYLVGFTRQQSEMFAQKIMEFVGATSSQTSFRLNFELLPAAYAEEALPCSVPVDPRREAQTQSFVTETLKCIGKGAWGAVADIPMMLWDGGKAIYNDPGKAWDSAWNSVGQAKKIFTEAGEVFGAVVDGFNALSTNEKAKMLCELTASVGTSALIAFFTAGAGAPAMFANLAKAALKIGTMTNSSKLLAIAEKLTGKSEEAARKIAILKKGPDNELIKAQADYAGARAAHAPDAAKMESLNKQIYGNFPRTESDSLRWAGLLGTEKLEMSGSYFTGVKDGVSFMGNAVGPYEKTADKLKFLRKHYNLTPEQQAKLQQLLAIAEDRANPKSALYKEVGISMRPRIDGPFSAGINPQQWANLEHVLVDYDKDLKTFMKSIDLNAALDRKTYTYMTEAKFAELKASQTELSKASKLDNEAVAAAQNRYTNALHLKAQAQGDNIKGKLYKGIYMGTVACESTRSSLQGDGKAGTTR